MSERRIEFDVELKMVSDWSIGSGGGRQGSLDSTVERDSDKLPYGPATTLRGIWRDAAEQVAYGLDNGRLGPWCDLISHAFGSQPALDQHGKNGRSPIPSRVRLTDARLPKSLRAALRDKPRLRNALVIIKPGVAIDKRSGRARTDFLRFDEVARQGAVLRANVTIALSGTDADQAIVCLVLASMRLVERLGGDRRRGSGRCELTLASASRIIETDASGNDMIINDLALPSSIVAAVETLKSITPSQPIPLRQQPLSTAFERPARATTDDRPFDIVPLDVTTETATIVAQNVLGNVVTSLDHIPGTMLLGGVGQMLRKAGLTEADIAAAFANGDIRVLPAFPAVEGRRGLPAPLALERLKDDTSGAGGKGRLRNALKTKEEDGQYKSIRGQYFAFGESPEGKPAFAFLRQSLVTRTHNTIEDARQKPTEAVGGVFTYEAIPAATALKSEIWIRRSLLDEPGLTRLKAKSSELFITIGRAKKAGYGAVRLAVGSHETFKSNAPQPGEPFMLYFASDTLLPCAPAPSIDASPAAAICDAIHKAVGSNVTVENGIVRTGRTEGWVGRWSLPRPSYVVLRAGSVVLMRAGEDFKYTNLAHEGLGARRSEGFGHILINPKFATIDPKDSIEIKSQPDDGNHGEVADVKNRITGTFANRIEQAAVHNAIRLHAELAADADGRRDKLGWSDHMPNMSQLGTLRAMMAGLRTPEDFVRTKNFIASLKKTDRASKWGSNRSDEAGHPLKILFDLFSSPQNIWNKIEFAEGEKWKDVLIVREPAGACSDEALQRYAIGCFLHAAIRAHKRAMESNTPNASREN